MMDCRTKRSCPRLVCYLLHLLSFDHPRYASILYATFVQHPFAVCKPTYGVYGACDHHLAANKKKDRHSCRLPLLSYLQELAGSAAIAYMQDKQHSYSHKERLSVMQEKTTSSKLRTLSLVVLFLLFTLGAFCGEETVSAHGKLKKKTERKIRVSNRNEG